MNRETVTVGGAIPFDNFKEKIRIVKELEKRMKNVFIEVDEGFVIYEYEEFTN